MVMLTLGTEFDEFIIFPTNRTHCGVLISWKANVVRAQSTRVDSFSVSLQFEFKAGRSWWFTGVYGPQSDALKV